MAAVQTYENFGKGERRESTKRRERAKERLRTTTEKASEDRGVAGLPVKSETNKEDGAGDDERGRGRRGGRGGRGGEEGEEGEEGDGDEREEEDGEKGRERRMRRGGGQVRLSSGKS